MRMEFDSIINQHEGINGGFIKIPFDVFDVYGAKQVKVLATFDGTLYRGSIVRMGEYYLLGVPMIIRKQINKSFGDTIHVILEKDEEEHISEIPVN